MNEHIAQRNPDWNYRIAYLKGYGDEPKYCSITIYPDNTNTPISNIRVDTLPAWILASIGLLDAAGGGHPVHGIGVKYGEGPDAYYWIGFHVLQIHGYT